METKTDERVALGETARQKLKLKAVKRGVVNETPNMCYQSLLVAWESFLQHQLIGLKPPL